MVRWWSDSRRYGAILLLKVTSEIYIFGKYSLSPKSRPTHEEGVIAFSQHNIYANLSNFCKSPALAVDDTQTWRREGVLEEGVFFAESKWVGKLRTIESSRCQNTRQPTNWFLVNERKREMGIPDQTTAPTTSHRQRRRRNKYVDTVCPENKMSGLRRTSTR